MSIVSRITPKKPEAFSDFLTNFDLHPLSNDIAKVTNEQSIKQSIKNLVLTNVGERFFQPTVGSTVYKSLFELTSPFAAQDLKEAINDVIKFNEKRAEAFAVNVSENYDGMGYTVTVEFRIINTQQISTLNFILKRVR
jgi:phage baseplate assembly protein W